MFSASIPPSRILVALPAAWSLLLGACIGNVVGLAQVALAESGLDTRQIAFDIPAQGLAQALELYGNVTGWEVLYNSNLAVGRRSSAIQGNFTPEVALARLLAGSGVTAQLTDEKSVVLVPNLATPPSVAGAASDTPASARLSYFGLIQDSMRTALCADGGTRAGRYRIAAQFWIGATGNVVRYQRLGSTGEPETDRQIDRRLRYLRIGSSPPEGFAEPVTILVVPQAPDVTLGCTSDHAGLQAIKAGP
jgi:secretin/TonB-like protein